jgi:hypothetical protein
MKSFCSIGARAGTLVAGPVFYFLFSSFAFPQGSLTPPGAAAPVMKTLDQIDQHITHAGEKRIDVLSLSGDKTNQHIIKASGSYYLSGNITGVAGKNGISIAAANVTLDLNGAAVVGNGSGSVTIGISGSASTNGRVFNGIVRNWGLIGVVAGDGFTVDHIIATDNTFTGVQGGSNSSITYCTANRNGQAGIRAELNTVVSHCTGSGNATGLVLSPYCQADHCSFISNGVGVTFQNGCVITDSTANANNSASGGGFQGVLSARGCVIARCAAAMNTGPGISVDFDTVISDCSITANLGDGIACLAPGNLINNCMVESNARSTGNGITLNQSSSVTNCLVNGNGLASHAAAGISGGTRTLISGCNVNDNIGDGIAVEGDSTVRNSRSSHNAANGIHTSGSGSRIEGNQARDNSGTGILANGGDAILRNTAGGNATPFDPASGDNFAPIQTPKTATNPFANISF